MTFVLQCLLIGVLLAVIVIGLHIAFRSDNPTAKAFQLIAVVFWLYGLMSLLPMTPGWRLITAFPVVVASIWALYIINKQRKFEETFKDLKENL